MTEAKMDETGVILMDFWAEWCAPCRMMNPVIKDIEKEYSSKMKVVKINADDSPELVQKYDISSLPSLVFLKNGKEVDRVVGFSSKDKIVGNIKKIIDKD